MTNRKGLHPNSPTVRRITYALKDELSRHSPGDRFLAAHGDHTAEAVARTYAVSTDVAQIALSVLVAEGLLDPQPGRGYFVNEIPASNPKSES